MLSGMGLRSHRAEAPAPRPRGAETAIEKVVSASAGVKNVTARDGGLAKDDAPAQAFRLSLELSNPPVEAAPVATSRVVAKAETKETKPEAPRSAPAPRREVASAAGTISSSTRPSPAAGRPDIKKAIREPTPRERAESEYRKAVALLRQKRADDSLQGFEAAIAHYPAHHPARQALVGLLLERKQYAEAERVLQEGLGVAPAQIGFAMTLARLQVNREDGAGAVATLRAGLEYARGSADYQAFLGALLQRQGAHADAIEQYRAALRLRPQSGVWWLGLGISLQATGRVSDAQDAYRRARASTGLNPELAAFAEQRLKQLQ